MSLPERAITMQPRRACLRRLLGSTGLALLALGSQAPRALAAGVLSQGSVGLAPVASSLVANLAAEQQAQSVGLQAQNQLSRIATAMRAMQTLQTSARNLALTAPNTVPNGLAPNGLVPNSPASWTAAQAPVQSNISGRTTVTINQTAAQALLSWNSFNVGAHTTVDFNQQGNSNWVALNQISPTGMPSKILGSIQASGQVYLINPNGIIFGGASQVNVGALIASSAQIGISSLVSAADSEFLATGIYGPNPGTAASFTGAGGNITVEPGAVIATSAPASVSAGGGFVLLMGQQVVNGGSISTPVGQTELAAGDNFYLRPGYSTTSNDSSTTRGNEIAVKLTHPGSSLTGGSGLVQNNGEITADTGDITLAGETVQQNGVALSTTSVAVRGTIHLLSSATDRFAAVTLGSNATTLIEPDLSSSATGLDSQRAGLLADAANANSIRQLAIGGVFNDLSPLGDLEDESRIEIVSGNTVEFQNGSDSSASGGQIAVYAANRVQVDTGALLDVSGSYAVPVSMASNDLPVNIQNFELRDNPQNRLTGSLSNSTVFVNAQDVSLVPASAADPNAREYSGGGLFEVSGYIANTTHSIGEYTALGGSITLATGPKGAVVAQSGSTFDINGGSLQYSSGYVQQSYLLATDGQVYNVNDAPAYLTYAGVYKGFTDDHARWSVTETYADQLHAPPEIYQQGYLVGRAAGSLTLSSPTSIFDGTVEASTANGPMQTQADPAGVSDPYLYTQSEVARPGSLIIGNLSVATLGLDPGNVAFGNFAPPAGSIADPIPKLLKNTTYLDAATLNNAGLGGLEVLTNGSVKVAAPLTFAPGAAVSLYGSSIDIAANVTAAGGSFTASQITPAGTPGSGVATSPRSGTGAIVVGNDATIDTAGLWTNLVLDPNVTFTEAFINGGAVDLVSVANLTLDKGSNIDSSAGGYTGLTAATKAGAGGAITLEAAAPNAATATPVGNLKLGATLESVGGTGGALTLYAPHFLISATELTPAPSSVVQLDPAFFTQGFSAYNLQSPGDIVVAPGTVVNVTEPTYQTTAATTSTPTGAAPGSAFALTLLPVYTPNTTDTAITQRAGASFSAEIVSPLSTDPGGRYFINHTTLLIGDNAAINVDPGQSIKLQSVSQLTIDGSLNAPGGTISATSLYNTGAALPGAGTVSVWVGPHAVLDASGQPVSFENAQGDRISLAPAGGTIILGNDTSTASVILRKGALVEASGSAASDEITVSALNQAEHTAQPVGQAIAVEGAGGSISLASAEGLYNNGTLIAAAGGANAAGGSLTMTLEPDLVPNATDTAEATPRIFVITQDTPQGTLPAHLKPGSSRGLTIGTAALSQQQITEGGFGSVTLFARDAFLFQGNVTLSAPQSITLDEGFLTDSSKQGSVTLDAPYVMLSGNTPGDKSSANVPISLIGGFSTRQATGIFTVNAAMIAINNTVRFGGLLPGSNGSVIDLAGFGAVRLNATGDLQFVAPNDYGGNAGAGNTNNLVTTADLTLTAREIYALDPTGPQIGVYNPTAALVVAGYNPVASTANGNFNPKKLLTIRQTPGTMAAAPDTIGGILTFAAPTINQGGVVWQPFGGVTFGEISPGSVDGFNFSGDPKGTVNFLPGSITSVSAAGLNIPFGGTTDGVNYDVNGAPISIGHGGLGLETVAGGAVPGSITVAALNTDIQPGATIDLRGGGTLSGAGFISGENGSTDVLTTPLLSISASGVSQPGIGANPVYAIVTGPQPQAAVAYTQSGATGSTPGLGQQIIIPAGVPGLPAGAYTLLPAQYALEPGGYRVELDGAAALDAAPVAGLPNGSYAVAGYTALAGTNVRATLATNVTITPGATVLNYAGYDTEAYSPFLLANATRLNEIRPTLPIDAGTLVLNVPTSPHVSLINTGSVDFAAAAGGLGGVLQIFSLNANVNDLPNFDIYNTAPAAGLRRNTVALSAPQIDAFHPYILEIGKPGTGNPGVKGVTLENGATLTAARVVLSAQTGGITLDSGSGIDTIGQGTLAVDSTTEGMLSNNGVTVLDVGNGYLVYGTTPVNGATYGPITIQNGAFIYTDGSIAFSTSGAVNIGTGASYGGKYIDLAVPVINIGDTTGLGANAPAGVALTEAELQALTAGVPNLDVPAVQIVNLTAFNSLNFYGNNADLDLTDPGVQLEINTPAIYGYGSGADVATIAANTIVWNGIPTFAANGNTIISTQPGATNPQGPGSGLGMLDLQASNIVLGFSPLDLPQRDVALSRLTAGFSSVNLNASSEIIANNQSTLAVYQSVPTYGQAGTGGTLNLNTPLLTADNGATIGFTAGGDINLSPYAKVANATGQVSEAAGGEIDLTAGNINNPGHIDIGSSVILPSGKLNLQATGNISLAAGSLLDLGGAVTQNNDQTVYGFGGDLVMASADGNISQNPGSVINVGAKNNTAGSVSLTATNAAYGQVSLQGTLLGASTGGYDGGSFSVEAQNLGNLASLDSNFATLNTNLDAGGFFQSRSFDIKQGDLSIGNGLEAQNVSVSLDNGSLTVTGLIDASFGGGGTINLAASGNLTLAGSAVLDAHGTVLKVDSNGFAIASENAPVVTLTSGGGTLTLGSGATIDLASADTTARGDLELNAPRTGGTAASATDSQSISDPVDGSVTTGAGGPAHAQGDNIAISASNPLKITGAATIALNGTATYANAPVPDPKNPQSQIIDQPFLDLINTDSVAFENAALTNSALASQITGLTHYGSTFHVRPGVQIVSASPTGDLTVEGDINLVGYRYGPGAVNFNPDTVNTMIANAGVGEPGTLAIRAGGNLNIYGSITDGFAQPVADTGTEFANGWVIFGGKQPYQQIQVLPQPITVTAGSTLPANAVVNFAVPIATGGRLEIGAVAPVPLTVDGDQHTQTAFTATSAILTSGGKTLFAQGQLVPAHSLIPDGSVIEAGGSLPFAVRVDQVMWPANTPLAVTSNVGYGNGIAVKLGIDTTLTTGNNAGAILPANAVIPAGSVLEFAHNTPGLTRPLNSQGQPLRLADGTLAPETVNTRLPAGGSQGQLYDLAQQLPATDLSWGIDLVAGADTAAAGTNVVQAASVLGDTGNLVLADAHYGVDLNNTHPHNVTETVVPAFSVVRTGTGALTLAAGGSIDEESSFGVYTAGTQSAGVAANDNLPQGVTKDGTALGVQNAGLNALIANYQAYYPTNGGNVLVSAQGDLNGFINIERQYQPYSGFNPVQLTDSDAIGGWLWLQGGDGEPGAWWTNYGALDLAPGSKTVQMTGFQGIGTLGGGNLTVNAGGNATGLNLVVASNGRVTPSATLLNGGGVLNATIGGAVNFTQAVQSPGGLAGSQDAGGVISDLRGNIAFSAGSIGTVQPIFGQVNGADPRFLSPLASEEAGFGNGFDVALGDSIATIDTRGSLAIDNAIDPGTVQNFVNRTPVPGAPAGSHGVTNFSLWTASTSTDLFSAGGDVVPVATVPGNPIGQNNVLQLLYTPSLLATAQNGNIYIGQSQELAPSPSGQLQLLAAGSVIGIGGPVLSISGTSLSLVATPSDPGITVTKPSGAVLFKNISSLNLEPVFFGLDTAATPLHENDAQPALIYAATGDILGMQFGVYLPASHGQSQQVIAAKPFDLYAGRDIVDSGTLLTPDIFLNLNATDISSVTAGRDIIESSFDIAGPGNLVVQAGRNLYEADQGAIVSLGRVFGITPANRDTGAAVSVLAGVGSGPDYTNFATEFLSPDSTLNLNDASAIIQSDNATLYSWLQANAGYTGSQTGAYAYFQTLPVAQQDVFLRTLYFNLLNNSGLEFNNPASAHYKSYILGQDAIARLFPANVTTGNTAPDTGDITLFGPSGVQTLFGGTIEALTPGGNTIVGVEGTTPPSTAGFITQGSGDIDIYAQDSVLLGESRVITTFGGNIVVWSALGNINAGRGSKTTIDFTPVQRIYDNYGNVFLSPTVPSNGAGIATLAPIPGVPPGNINLVAPVGTVDAGEAGIRGSGNLNIAALHVVNAANISVQGSTTGVPTAVAPDVGGLTSAGNAAGAAAQAAENAAPKQHAAPLPSIWIVEILGYGGGSAPDDQDQKKKKKHLQTISSLSSDQTKQALLF